MQENQITVWIRHAQYSYVIEVTDGNMNVVDELPVILAETPISIIPNLIALLVLRDSFYRKLLRRCWWRHVEQLPSKHKISV